MTPDTGTVGYDPAAERAARQWLDLVDQGDAATSWANASTLFRERVNESDWAKALAGARQPFGPVVGRTLQGGRQVSELPGAPDGDYVVFTFGSEFEHKRSAVETVTPMKDRDNQWRVSGYFIR